MKNPLINCEIELILTWSINCVITNSKGTGKISKNDTKPYVMVVILWTQDNSKLLQQLKSGFKRIINWNKCELKLTVQEQINISIDCLIQVFSGHENLLILSIEDEVVRTGQDIVFWK